MDESTNALGAFLRARRELVTPQQANIRDHGARRVPGLRREEVALPSPATPSSELLHAIRQHA